MPLLSRLASLWCNLLQKNRVEQALTEEVQAYLEMLIELKIKDGLHPSRARWATQQRQQSALHHHENFRR
jgi:hypothetical protein